MPDERDPESTPADTPPSAPRLRARPGMLPGMALIAVYLLLMAMLNAFAAINGKFSGTGAKYSVLGVCTLLVIGVFGLLRLRRWGWALVTVGCLVMAGGYFWAFAHTRIPPYIVQGLFDMVFFLYLIRTEVRDRLR
jgi:peptidoglycan/LPS O-acetylase OafA/YrhL